MVPRYVVGGSLLLATLFVLSGCVNVTLSTAGVSAKVRDEFGGSVVCTSNPSVAFVAQNTVVAATLYRMTVRDTLCSVPDEGSGCSLSDCYQFDWSSSECSGPTPSTSFGASGKCSNTVAGVKWRNLTITSTGTGTANFLFTLVEQKADPQDPSKTIFVVRYELSGTATSTGL